MSHSEAGSHPLHPEAGSSICLSPHCPPSLTEEVFVSLDCELPSSVPGEASRVTGCLTLENPEIPLTFSSALYENRGECPPLCLFQHLESQNSRQPRQLAVFFLTCLVTPAHALLTLWCWLPQHLRSLPCGVGGLGHLFSAEESAQTGAADGNLILCCGIMVFLIFFCKRFCFKGQYGWVSASSSRLVKTGSTKLSQEQHSSGSIGCFGGQTIRTEIGEHCFPSHPTESS